MESIRETIAETEKRIKRLGERSQEISGIVNLINTIAERTHVLALNASMQAAVAGETVGLADIEVLEVHHLRDRRALLHGDRRILVHAGEVARVEQQAEVFAVDGVDQADHAVGAVDEEAVVLHERRDAVLRRIISELLAGLDGDREFALKGDGRVRFERTAEG